MRLQLAKLAPIVFAIAAAVVMLAHVRTVEAGTAQAAAPLERNIFADLPALQTPAPQTPAELPEGKGKDVTVKLCSNCHKITVWTKKRHSADEWSAVIDDMVVRGMNASDSDIATVTDYLAANFAPVTKTTPPPADPSGTPPPQ